MIRIGRNGPDTLQGSAGDDTLRGLGGNDLLLGGRGADVLNGGAGDDDLWLGADGGLARGDAGRDHLRIDMVIDSADLSAGHTVAEVHGGAGVDLLDLTLTNHGSGMVVFALLDPLLTQGIDLQASGFEKLRYQATLAGRDVIFGGNLGDYIDGADASTTFWHDSLLGGAGNDTLISDGDCTLRGGDGDDLLVAGTLDPAHNLGKLISGGAGIDTLRLVMDVDFAVTVAVVDMKGDVELASGVGFGEIERWDVTGSALDDSLTGGDLGDTINGAGGSDTLTGGVGQDALLGGIGNDSLYGGAQADLLQGQDGNDGLIGLTGADRLLGGLGEDELQGGIGNDTLIGGDGADRLEGGQGDDTLTGGLDADLFDFLLTPALGGVDWVRDFQLGFDKIRLDFGDMASGTLADAAFQTGTRARDATDRVIYDPATGDLRFDADGRGGSAAVLIAHVTPTSPHDLTAGDILIL